MLLATFGGHECVPPEDTQPKILGDERKLEVVDNPVLGPDSLKPVALQTVGQNGILQASGGLFFPPFLGPILRSFLGGPGTPGNPFCHFPDADLELPDSKWNWRSWRPRLPAGGFIVEKSR